MDIPTKGPTEAIQIEAYYVEERKDFVYRLDNPVNPTRPFRRVDKGQMKDKLRKLGFYHRDGESGELSEVNMEIIRIIEDCALDFCGPLAGHDSGFIALNNRNILVTEDKCPMPALEYDMEADPDGECWQDFNRYLEALFGPEQFDFFVGWLKIAYETVLKGRGRPGQILALAGESGVGKTFLQSLITLILGRAAKPYNWMSGGSNFNSELFGAEHLVIGDELSSTDYNLRRQLGNKLKQLVAEPMQKYHKKGVDAFDLYPIWRCSMSFNYDGDDILVLPPMDDSLKEKIMVFHCYKGAIPEEIEDPWESDFKNTLVNQMPFFLHWLVNIEIPQELRHPRYGVRTYHNDEIMNKLGRVENEFDFWDIVVSCYMNEEDPGEEMKEFLVTTSDLQAVILKQRPYLGNSKGLLSSTVSCGIQLKKIADRNDGRASHQTRSTWKLCRVPQELWK
jgi:hypothetical protein